MSHLQIGAVYKDYNTECFLLFVALFSQTVNQFIYLSYIEGIVGQMLLFYNLTFILISSFVSSGRRVVLITFYVF